jgi:hypothetical protein
VYAPLFQLRAFDVIDNGAKGRVLELLLEALIAADIEYLRVCPSTPSLYESGVVYEEEPGERDNWQDIPETLGLGNGDCEDLGCWRIAELRFRAEERATPFITWREVGDRTVYHIAVRRSDGTVEDPSRLLGMGMR